MSEENKIIIKRTKRKTASIYIEREGSLSVFVPEKTTDQDVETILKANEYKIYKYQAKRKMLNQKTVKREPVNGQSYLYLGRNYYLQYHGESKEIEFKGRNLYAPEHSTTKLNDQFKEFYRKHGYSFITPRVKKYAEMMGLEVEKVSILELKTRWASCSEKKPKINFHWKMMMAPVSVIEYVIVHELAHFKYKRHNAQFWNAVDKVMPSYRKQTEWLKEFGASLTL